MNKFLPHPSPLLIACAVAMTWTTPQVVAEQEQHPRTNITFPENAAIDVSQAPYFAIPNDAKDDTAALQQAISDHVGTGRFLYLPKGIYDVSQTLEARNNEGKWRAHLTLQGAGRDATIIRLCDKAIGFDSPSKPRPIIATGSHWEEGDHADGGGNKAFRNNVMDITIDTGSNNPGSIGIAWAVSNFGTIKHVKILSGDGQGSAGISMRRAIPGPGLIKHVSIDGFDVGVDISDVQYGVTIEHLTLRNQRVAGLRTDKNLMHIRKLHSQNSVPALISNSHESMIVLIDSTLINEADNQHAIDCSGGLLLRNIELVGSPEPIIKCQGALVSQEDATHGWASTVVVPPTEGYHNAPGLLTAIETPHYWNPNLDDWAAVGPRREGEGDDTAAIQRAIDSGKSTIYFPCQRTYFISDTIIVRGQVREIIGMGAELSLGAAKEPFGDRDNPRAVFQIDTANGHPTHFRHLFFNTQYGGEMLFDNHSPDAVVIEHCGGWVGANGSRRTYRNASPNNGPLFIEDAFLPGWEFKQQTVYARQLNPENYDGAGDEAQVINQGGKLWILGFKTEGPAPYLSTTNGGTTELLGAYNYVSASANMPASSILYPIEDAQAAISFTTDNFANSDYAIYIKDTTEAISPDALPYRGYSKSRMAPYFRTQTKP